MTNNDENMPPETTALPLKPYSRQVGMESVQYKHLRSRLDKLGYLDSFSPDSLALVHRMLEDLVQTTDSCRRLKTEMDRSSQIRQRLETEAEPLSQEIVHLTKENNQLHMDLISAADMRDDFERKSQMAIRRLQNDLTDVKFINRQLMAKIEKDQQRSEAERFRMEQVLQTVGFTATKEVDGTFLKGKIKVPTKAIDQIQRIDIETGLEPIENELALPRLPLADPQTADMLRLAEAKIEHLSDSQKSLLNKNSDLQSEIDVLKEQVKVREEEISRLGSLLEIERGTAAGYRRRLGGEAGEQFSGNGSGSRAEQLEMQVDYLHETISELEQKIASIDKEKSVIKTTGQETIRRMSADLEASNERNEALLRDLNRLEAMVRDLEKIKASQPAGNTGGGNNDKKSLPASRSRLPGSRLPATKKSTPPSSKTNNTPATQDKNSSNHSLFTKELRDARAQLTEITAKNEALQEELEKLQLELLDAKKYMNERETQLLNIQRSHPYIETADNISNMGAFDESNGSGTTDKELRKLIADLESKNSHLHQDLAEAQRQVESLRQLESELIKLRSLCTSTQQQLQQQRTEVERLQRENEQSEQKRLDEVEQKKRFLLEATTAKAERETLNIRVAQLDSDVRIIKGERDELQLDRDNLKQLYQQSVGELSDYRDRETRWRTRLQSGRPSAEEGDWERLMVEMETLQQANTSLRDRLREMTEDLAGGAVAEHNQQLQQQCQQLEEQVKQMQSALSDKQKLADNLQQTCDALHRQSDDQQARIQQLSTKLTATIQQQQQPSSNVAPSLNAAASPSAEQHRRLIEEWDRERDRWQNEIDAKTERVAELETMLRSSKSQELDADHRVQSTRDEIAYLQSHLHDRERELASVRRQLDELAADRVRLTQQCDQATADCRQSAADMDALSRENQMLNHELSSVVAQKSELEHSMEVLRREQQSMVDRLRVKEDEKDQIVSSHRKLLYEHSEFEKRMEMTQQQIRDHQTRQAASEAQLSQMREMLEQRDEQLHRIQLDYEHLEKQCTELTESHAALENEIQSKEVEADRMMHELLQTKDVISQMQSTKEKVQRQFSSVSAELDRANQCITKLQQDQQLSAERIKEECEKRIQMERLVSEERMRKVQLEIDSKELKSTNEALAQHLNSVNSDTSSRNVDLMKLYAEMNTMKLEMDQLKAANEQLRGDRMKQDLVAAAVKPAAIQQTDSMEHYRQLLSPGEVSETPEEAGQKSVKSEPPKQIANPQQQQSPFERDVGRELESTRRRMEEYERLLVKGQQQRSLQVASVDGNVGGDEDDGVAVSAHKEDHDDDDDDDHEEKDGQGVQTFTGDSSGDPMTGHLRNALKYQRRIRKELETLSPVAQDSPIVLSGTGVTAATLFATPTSAPATIEPRAEKRSGSMQQLQKPQQHESTLSSAAINVTDRGGSPNMTSASDDLFRESLEESEKRRLRLEDENSRLMAIVREVTRELKHASSASSSSQSLPSNN